MLNREKFYKQHSLQNYICFLTEEIKSREPAYERLAERGWHELSIPWIKLLFSRAGFCASPCVNVNPATDVASCFLSISMNSS